MYIESVSGNLHNKCFPLSPCCMLAGLVATVISLSLADSVTATTIRSPTSVVSNTLGNYDGGRVIQRTIDQSGLLTGFTSGVTDFATYISSNPLHEGDSGTPSFNAWFGADGITTGDVDFDLGAQYAISQLALWNDDFHGASNITVFTSNDPGFGIATNVGSFTPAIGTIPLSVEVFDLNDSIGQFVRVRISGTHSSSNLVGWGEIAAETDVVPEPTTLALATFGLLGIVYRRRKRA